MATTQKIQQSNEKKLSAVQNTEKQPKINIIIETVTNQLKA